MNENEILEAQQNKAIRGYIIRSLAKGYNNAAITSHVSNALYSSGLIISPDITKYIDYLINAGYIEFTDKKIKAYQIYAKDPVIKLTKAGVDLVEGTIEDAGVEI